MNNKWKVLYSFIVLVLIFGVNQINTTSENKEKVSKLIKSVTSPPTIRLHAPKPRLSVKNTKRIPDETPKKRILIKKLLKLPSSLAAKS